MRFINPGPGHMISDVIKFNEKDPERTDIELAPIFRTDGSFKTFHKIYKYADCSQTECIRFWSHLNFGNYFTHFT